MNSFFHELSASGYTSTADASSNSNFSINHGLSFNARTKAITESVSVASVTLSNRKSVLNYDRFRLLSVNIDRSQLENQYAESYMNILDQHLEDGEVIISNLSVSDDFTSDDLVFSGTGYDYTLQKYYDYYKIPDDWTKMRASVVVGKLRSETISGKTLCVKVL
ncbi:hypothetical protein CPL00134L_CDS0014 [Escherichia phage Phagiculus]